MCPQPARGTLTADDSEFLVVCRNPERRVRINSASYAVTTEPRRSVAIRTVKHPSQSGKTEVIIIGMIHGAHRTSTRSSTAVLQRLLREIDPDAVLTEILANRFDAAMVEFERTGAVAEPRVLRFPEYVDVLFPLTRSMLFTIVPTAAWTSGMAARRTAVLRQIREDSTRRDDWNEYTRANQQADSVVQLRGADDPYFVNSREYDALQNAAHEPFNRLFNDEIGPGGWENINRAHFANIAAALDERRGTGQRVVITYGAGHREWFMRALRLRSDIELVEVASFLERIGVPRSPPVDSLRRHYHSAAQGGRHARQLRWHVGELLGRQYWHRNSPR